MKNVSELAAQYVMAIGMVTEIIRLDGATEEDYSDLMFLLVMLGFDIEEVSEKMSKIELLQELCRQFGQVLLFESE